MAVCKCAKVNIRPALRALLCTHRPGGRRGELMLKLVWTAVIAVVAIGGIILAAPEPQTPAERDDTECKRQFSNAPEIVVNDCKLRVLTRYLVEKHNEKIDAAARAIR